MKLSLRFALILSLMALFLSACAADAGDPADAVESYLTAMSEGDPDAMVVVSCADWETQARLSADSYIAVETVLNNLNCETQSEEGDAAEVTCEGTISVSYDGEQTRELPLSGFTFEMVKQGGSWLVCNQK
jgi:hypothetical protein